MPMTWLMSRSDRLLVVGIERERHLEEQQQILILPLVGVSCVGQWYSVAVPVLDRDTVRFGHGCVLWLLCRDHRRLQRDKVDLGPAIRAVVVRRMVDFVSYLVRNNPLEQRVPHDI